MHLRLGMEPLCQIPFSNFCISRARLLLLMTDIYGLLNTKNTLEQETRN